MDSKHIPEGVWDDCLVWCAKTRSSSCLNLPQLQGQKPLNNLTGETTNILHLCEFGFYEVVWFISPEASTTHQVKHLGRYMGPSETVGEAMCSIILDHKLNYFDRTSVFPLSAEDKADPDIMRKVKGFESVMEQAFAKNMQLT
jgi:hypothetical protein